MRSFVPSLAARWKMLSLLLLLPLALAACARTTPPSSDTTPQSSDVGTVKPEPSGNAAPPAMVWSIAGIRPGKTDNSDVVSMYGTGLLYAYQDQPADRRYYTDSSHSVTLLVGTHTDDIVVVVGITEGTVLPPGVDPALAVSSLSVPVEIDHGITLGMTPGEIEGVLGRPDLDQTAVTTRTFVYGGTADDPAEAGYISYNATCVFVNDRLQSVEIYAGE
ncbi:MAG: hypothetical protein ACYC5Q_16620 [Thermoleophilia bacterium]